MNVIVVWFVLFTLARFIYYSQCPCSIPDLSIQELEALCVKTDVEVPVRWGKVGHQIIYKFESKPMWTISDTLFHNFTCRLRDSRSFDTQGQCQDFFQQFSLEQLSYAGRLKCSQ